MPCTTDLILSCAEDVLEFASKHEGEQQETIFRTVIGRAYYAAYHVALDIALKSSFGDIPKKKRTHSKLWKHFGKTGDHDTRREGFSLKETRVTADYEMSETVTERDAIESVAASKELIASLRRQYVG